MTVFEFQEVFSFLSELSVSELLMTTGCLVSGQNQVRSLTVHWLERPYKNFRYSTFIRLGCSAKGRPIDLTKRSCAH